MAEPVLMSPWIPVVAAVAGSFVTGVVACYTNYTNKKTEEKKHLTTLIFGTATEMWKKDVSLAEKEAEEGRVSFAFPLDAHLFHMFKLSKVLLDNKISKENIEAKINEAIEFADIISRVYKKMVKD